MRLAAPVIGLLALGGLAACSSSAPTSVSSSTARGPVAQASAPVVRESPSAVPSATSTTKSAPPPSSPTGTASATSQAPASNTPRALDLGLGETAHLTYFDVTLLRAEPGKDQVSYGWKVRVCYTSPRPGQNADGATRVSKNPWSVLAVDAEGGEKHTWVPVGELPFDPGWVPQYDERLLSVGQCQTGWIAVKNDSPDVQFAAVRYHPADFGDTVTWTVR